MDNQLKEDTSKLQTIVQYNFSIHDMTLLEK
jgi:hypothetical protein